MNKKAKWVKLWILKHHDSILKLSREESGDILQNIFRYVYEEPLSKMTPISEFVFEYIKQDIDSSLRTYENKVEIAQENGKNGGRPPKTEKPDNKQKETVCHQYGEYKNVLLSDEELKKLREEAPEVYLKKIEDLSCYMKSTGKGYKSHYATIRNWIKKGQKKEGESVESGDKGKVFNVEDFL